MPERHDYEGLNDLECWVVDYYFEQLTELRAQRIVDIRRAQVAFRRALAKYKDIIEPEEIERVRAYVSARTGLVAGELPPEEDMDRDGFLRRLPKI